MRRGQMDGDTEMIIDILNWLYKQPTFIKVLMFVGYTAMMVFIGWLYEHIKDRRRRAAEAMPRYLRRKW